MALLGVTCDRDSRTKPQADAAHWTKEEKED